MFRGGFFGILGIERGSSAAESAGPVLKPRDIISGRKANYNGFQKNIRGCPLTKVPVKQS